MSQVGVFLSESQMIATHMVLFELCATDSGFGMITGNSAVCKACSKTRAGRAGRRGWYENKQGGGKTMDCHRIEVSADGKTLHGI